ncbi:MAG: F0F1 ATP synthase subunit A [bacterium]|nr:F0F1 ATP synthase subunit A [bacterium]
MEHRVLLTDLVNTIFRWVLNTLGFEIGPKVDVVPQHIIFAFLATTIIIVLFKMSVKKLSIFPGKGQNALEMLYKFFQGLAEDFMGREGRQFVPVLATLGLFIAVSNLMGLMPEMSAPTSNLNVTAGCAIFIFIYYHAYGVKKHGFVGYLKTFMGPEWWLAWLFFPIEIVSHFSRPLSLAMRLFGNIFGEDLVIIIIAGLVPFVAPLPMMALATFCSLLQAFIFVILSTIYLAGAMSEEH